MTVINNDTNPSDPAPFTIQTPAGVEVSGVDVGPESAVALRRVTAGLLRAGPIGPCAAPDCTVELPTISGRSQVVSRSS